MPQRTILISDDDATVVNSLSRLLRAGGFAVVTDTESDVENLASVHRPSLIILDIHQREDGRPLLCRLKRNPQTRDLPVAILTAVEHEQTRQYCLAMGAAAYFTKPFDYGFLHEVAALAGVPGLEPYLPRKRRPAFHFAPAY
jgi:two-component system response regulator AdeR